MNLRWLLGATLLIGLGCANRSVSSAGDTGTTGSPESSGTEEQGTTGAATIEPDSSTGTTDETGTTSFGCVPDLDPPGECDLWCPACPRAHKCMPWGEENRRARNATWEATHCSPLAPDVNAPNERCEVDAHLTSGHDDCDVGSMCWHVDPHTLEGMCIPFCDGSPANPSCADPGHECVIVNPVVPLCLRGCNPLHQDCPVDQRCRIWNPACDVGRNECLPLGPDARFVCQRQPPDPQPSSYGDPCQQIDDCGDLLCAPASAVPGCQGSVGCCTDFCDLAAPNCSGEGSGQVCVPLYPMGAVQEGLDDSGYCTVP